jgi:hypothetical protein
MPEQDRSPIPIQLTLQKVDRLQFTEEFGSKFDESDLQIGINDGCDR